MYRDHATAAYRYAVHLTGSHNDADDLVQSAFMEAHRYLMRGGTIVSPRAWLATVVRSRAINLRRDQRETAASDHLEVLAGARDDHVADAAREELERVRARLFELPEAQHQAFVLRYWSELSYREIADVLDTTESAVESLLTRARAAIMSEADIPEQCLAARRHLSAETSPPAGYLRHLDECARCSAACARLARAGGIAAAALLVPRLHVAQALAATMPGFTTAAAASGTAIGASGTTLAAGKAGIALKAAIAAVAVAGSAALVHAHIQPRVPGAPPRASWAASSHPTAATPAAPAVLTVRDAVIGRATDRAEHRTPHHDARAHPASAATDVQDGSRVDDTQGQGASTGNDQGQDEAAQGDSAPSDDPGDGNSPAAGSGQDDSSGGGSTDDSGNQNS
jgi:RNA polymerase sigma-70 factor (ECF subfamily)